MKYSRVILLVGVVLLLAQVSFAQGTIDPSIVFGGGGSCGTTMTETAITQSFTVPTVNNSLCAGTNGFVDFTNQIGVSTTSDFDIVALIVTVNTPFIGSVSCSISTTNPPTSTAFFNNATPIAPNECLFNVVTIVPTSIIGGATYGLQFGAIPFTDAPAPLTSLNVTLTAVPEPATLLLLGTGLCGLGALRKRLKGSKTTA